MKNSIFTEILLFVNTLSGVPYNPPSFNSNWTVIDSFEPEKGLTSFKAASNSIGKLCAASPESFIEFPVVIYGAQQVVQNGKVLSKHGSLDHKSSPNILSAPVVSCQLLSQEGEVTWTVSGYSPYFSRVHNFPELQATKPLTHLFAVTLYVGSAIGMILLAIFSMSILFKKEKLSIAASLTGSTVFIAMYMIGSVLPEFNISLPTLTANRVSDCSLIAGVFLLIYLLFLEGFVSKATLLIHSTVTSISLFLVLTGRTGDAIQCGTSLSYISVTLAMLSFTYNLTRSLVKSRFSNLVTWLKFQFGLIFALSFLYEMNLFSGSIHSVSVLPIGCTFSFLTLILSVNQRIRQAYAERDLLRTDLERQVNEKTSHLSSALKEKELAQAELIQSAKLASLGTLSAGIAHEINNSVNYINGAIIPLEKLVMKDVSEERKEKVTKLFASIREGSAITSDIVQSLRNFTGLNQAKFKDVELKKVIDSVCTILRSKIKGRIEIKNRIPESLTLFGNQVGWNQIFMNLISNAVDAMKDGGEIEIFHSKSELGLSIFVRDSGVGIPKEIQDRVFDPFFSTKEVGSGTGLGLHIVMKEVERHQGTIRIEESKSTGTTFHIFVPNAIAESLSKGVAA